MFSGWKGAVEQVGALTGGAALAVIEEERRMCLRDNLQASFRSQISRQGVCGGNL